MKKIIYSGFVKFLFVILFIGSITLGALTVTHGILTIYFEEEQIYSFETDFADSYFVKSLLNHPESVVSEVYYDLAFEYDEQGRSVPRKENLLGDRGIVKEELEKRLGYSHYSDKIV